jgi:superfamily I DNA and/or RNA helicase
LGSRWSGLQHHNAGKERVGTVHTFQGKEQSIVWMVLGCDTETAGAVAWASKKPNLLNVAMTRAKHRFFLIGSEALWAGMPYFRDANSNVLPRITPGLFLRRLQRGSAG